MILHTNKQIEAAKVDMVGAKDVYMKILIGSKEGSKNMVMRHFRVLPGGHTPKHTHDFEHVVKIEKNKGIFIDKNGKKHEIKTGQCLFVEPNEEHQFKNPFEKPFEFICIIPNPEKNQCCMVKPK